MIDQLPWPATALGDRCRQYANEARAGFTMAQRFRNDPHINQRLNVYLHGLFLLAHGCVVFTGNSVMPDLTCTCDNYWRWKAKTLKKKWSGLCKDIARHPACLPSEDACNSPEAWLSLCLRYRFQPVNLVLGTGPSRIISIDADGAKGQVELADLEALHGVLPVTWSAISGSGKGRHYHFRMPDGAELVGGSDHEFGSATGEGSLDVKASGGSITMPPSLHRSGGTYSYVAGCEPWSIALAEAPEWVLAEARNAIQRRHDRKRAQGASASGNGTSEPDDNPFSREGARYGSAGIGFAGHLNRIGDPPHGTGYREEVYGSLCAFFRQAGSDADASAARECIVNRILDHAAPRAEGKRPAEYYTTDRRLDYETARARAFIREVEQTK